MTTNLGARLDWLTSAQSSGDGDGGFRDLRPIIVTITGSVVMGVQTGTRRTWELCR
jgi:hypothetical protein